MSIDIEKLEALAREATPGPWHKGAYGGIYEGSPGQNKPGIGQCRFRDGSARANGDNNEGFIAAADPSAILALITRLREAEQREQALAAHVERLKEALHCALMAWHYEASQGDGIMEEHGSTYEECNKRCDESPATSLARLKAQWQVEAIEQATNDLYDAHGLSAEALAFMADRADEIRLKAEGGDA